MINKIKYIILFTLLSSIGFSSSIKAQIIPDNTLGTENSRITPSSPIKGIPSNLIEGGATRNNSLFHSFQEFNIQQSQGAYFANPNGINNIFTRITGNNISNINGTLGVLGDANLFLINPNGIIFGKQAKLDINGSFFATTASSILVDNTIPFSAKNPQSILVLRENFEPGLGFSTKVSLNMDRASGNITVNGSGHNLDFNTFIPALRKGSLENTLKNPNRTISLIGNTIKMNGGVIEAKNIELTSISEGQVKIESTRNDFHNFLFDYNGVKEYGDITLLFKSLLDSSNDNQNNIRINSSKLLLKEGSVIFISNSNFQKSGEILVNSNRIEVDDGLLEFFAFQDLPSVVQIEQIRRGFSLQDNDLVPIFTPSSIYVEAIENSKGANINILTGSLLVKNGAQILNRGFDNSKMGNINIQAQNTIEVLNSVDGFPLFSSISSQNFSSNLTVSGNLNLSTKNLFVKNGGNIGSVTLGSGSSGVVNINASNYIELNGIGNNSLLAGSGLTSLSLSSQKGNANDLIINTSKLNIINGATITTSTLGSGDGGKITINANDSILIKGVRSQISSAAPIVSPEFQVFFRLNERPTGNSGNIEISTQQLNMADNAQITSFNQGMGNAGSINLRIDNAVLNRGSKISAFSNSRIGGIINISGLQPNFPANIISLNNNSKIETNNSTTTNSNVGTIDIYTGDLILNNGSRISANVSDSPQNPLDPNLNLVGGNINIQATGDIRVLNNSSIAAEVNNRPGGAIDGGNINIEAQGSIKIANNISPRAAISASVTEFGDGGNIKITLPNGILVGVNDADIRATAVNGNGGDIFIEAFTILTTSDIDITASSERGLDGNVEINTVITSDRLITFDRAELPAYNRKIIETCSVGLRKAQTTEPQSISQSSGDQIKSRFELNLFVSTISQSIQGETIDEIKLLEPNAAITVNGDTYLGKACLTKISN